MIDKIIATASVLLLAAFLAVVVWFVAEPDLAIVIAIGVAMAAFDLWRTVTAPRNDGKNGSE